MKAIAAALATAAVLAGAAWASNVTPQQFAKLNARVTALSAQVAALERTTDCLKSGWNATGETAYLVSPWGGFDTKSGNLSIFAAPAPADGLPGTGYLVTTSTLSPGC